MKIAAVPKVRKSFSKSWVICRGTNVHIDHQKRQALADRINKGKRSRLFLFCSSSPNWENADADMREVSKFDIVFLNLMMF